MRKESANMEFSETHDVELKGVLNEKVEKEIVAFLNTNNGTIYVGVENNGKVIGIPTNKLDESMKKISDIITDKILPNPQEFVTTSAFMEDGKWIIKIDVLKGNALYYIKKYGRSASGCYMRIGTTAKSMTGRLPPRLWLTATLSTTRLLSHTVIPSSVALKHSG